jgi:hypothetical protein
MRKRSMLTLCIVAFTFTAGHAYQSMQLANPAIMPDKFAWQLFIYINHPTKDYFRRWETWATPDDLFNDPQHTPQWRGRRKPPAILTVVTQLDFIPTSTMEAPPSQTTAQRPEATAPGPGELNCSESSALQEIHLNKSLFNSIVDQDLWYLEGQENAFRKRATITFPSDSISVKTIWTPVLRCADTQGFCREKEGKFDVLAGLQIASRRLKNWVWATFELETNACRCHFIVCKDTFGANPSRSRDTSPIAHTPELKALFDDAGMGSEWEHIWKHYILVGTQTAFIESTHDQSIFDPTPTSLGNSISEARLKTKSSCITCHARSSIGGDDTRLALVQQDCTGFQGTPKRSWFFTHTNQLKALPLGFVWSLMRAKSRNDGQAIPPSDCK